MTSLWPFVLLVASAIIFTVFFVSYGWCHHQHPPRSDVQMSNRSLTTEDQCRSHSVAVSMLGPRCFSAWIHILCGLGPGSSVSNMKYDVTIQPPCCRTAGLQSSFFTSDVRIWIWPGSFKNNETEPAGRLWWSYSLRSFPDISNKLGLFITR